MYFIHKSRKFRRGGGRWWSRQRFVSCHQRISQRTSRKEQEVQLLLEGICTRILRIQKPFVIFQGDSPWKIANDFWFPCSPSWIRTCINNHASTNLAFHSNVMSQAVNEMSLKCYTHLPALVIIIIIIIIIINICYNFCESIDILPVLLITL